MSTPTKIKQRMYAIITPDQTAMGETALCSVCYPDPAARAAREQAARYSGDPLVRDGHLAWEDCTDNDALECWECGGRSC